MPNEKDLHKENSPADMSLDDDRRIKTLSPGTLTAKRFFRNKLAVAGLVILSIMFLFSFVGGALIPYRQEQVFFREDLQNKEFAGVSQNQAFHFTPAPEETFDAVLQAQFTLAQGKGLDSFSYGNAMYTLTQEGTDFYAVHRENILVALAHKDLLQDMTAQSFGFAYAVLKAYTTGQNSFSYEDTLYTLLPDGTIEQAGAVLGTVSRWLVRSASGISHIPQELKNRIVQAVQTGETAFSFAENGNTRTFTLAYNGGSRLWSVRENNPTFVWDSYAPPSKKHPLGTDKNGMDMLTRLMYGGRISLVIGFIVVLIAAFFGVVLGGIAGYFGKWIDQLVMRLVDIFYCIPSTPILIILGAAMDAMRVDSQIRMLFLMLILGLLGWPGIARLVRGQILSLREQEFMTATEACGLSIPRRLFRHLIPNVIPQLIVSCTMSLGSTILTEATLSFLGLGVKFPFASWGNIISDVSSAHVLTSYWFVWIPAGVCLVLAVLGFNFVGDGLRDAFDPKMKR